MIIVFGSIHEDINVTVDKLPKPGETLIGYDHNFTVGGKGANQAVAATLAGSHVSLISCVGRSNGSAVVESIRQYGVDVKNVTFTTTASTGFAYILKDTKGENEIVIVRGANLELSAEALPDDLWHSTTIIMLQMEIGIKANIDVLQKAKENGVKTMLNLAPVMEIDKAVLQYVDYLVVNVHEASALLRQLCGIEPDYGGPGDGKRMAIALAQLADLVCIITLGSEGSLAATPSREVIETPAHTCANVVDQTGAGDCYCGYLAAGLEKQMDLRSAMRFASAAASLSCRKRGTQISYPTLEEVNCAISNG